MPFEADPPYWSRGQLHCDPAQQHYAGIEYCTDTDGQIYIVVVDLHSPSLRFEYLIAEGVSKQGRFGECQDVNIPGLEVARRGCGDPNNLDFYPIMSLESAAKRIPDASVVINSDYGAGDQGVYGKYRGHGPEGLTVVRGDRLDGPGNGDTDNNAVRRPWFAVGNSAPLHAELSQFPIGGDDGEKPDWIYTAVGGAPWLIKNGVIQIDEIRTCNAADPTSCRDGAEQTAIGLSQDRRWLFLVIDVRRGELIELANFMQAELEAWDAFKFDGGGSSQLWYGGRTIEGGDGRQLSQYLAVVAQPGNGIEWEPAPAPAPEPAKNLQERLSQWIQKQWTDAQTQWNQFWQEQTEKLQRQFNAWVEEWTTKAENWWRDFWAEQQRNLERALEQWINDLAGQLCGSPALILLGVSVTLWRRQR